MPQCPACGEQNAQGARFCSACGTALTPAEPKTEERKVVSVLFVDLVDFTSRSDQADPEDVRAMLQPYHSRVKAEIETFGGMVEKFIGDAVMAVFGAPVSHGDDAERAVRAGLRVLDAIQELNKEDPALDLTVRAAVNTGEAIVDARQQPDVAQGLAHGDVVNTASRLQTGAPPGGLVVGEETYRATRTVIGYRPVEPIQAKGKREPLTAWLAVETLTAPAERAASGAPMVGRDRELELLQSLWETSVSEGRPHLATVVGPPGIGKTRLSREFSAFVEAAGGRLLRGRSLPYGESSGYRAFAQQVKDAAGVFETDSPADARAKLTALVAALTDPEEATEIRDHLSVLVGLAADGVSGDQAALFFSARRFVEQLARERPLLLLFEDIHWSDASQLDLIGSLASRVRDVPAMFLTLTRPELFDTRPGWGAGLTGQTTMELRPLGPDDAKALTTQLLPALAEIPGAVDRLTVTAEGNPLFIEELAASLAERMDEATAELPTNVKTTIAARLDTLPPSTRAVLLDAAVVGKVFWRGALLGIAERTAAQLEDDLDQLESRDFIHRENVSQIQGDREYVFKHMLIREVAYSTLPRAARRERHAAVARFIEAASAERLDEAAAILAYHWREAGDDERALDYLLRAADHATQGWAKGEATALYAQALELIPEGDRARRRAVEIRLGVTMVELGNLTSAVPLLDEVLAEAEGRERLEALLARCRAAFWGMDAEGMRRLSLEAVALAEQLGEDEYIGPALALRSEAESMAGRMAEAFELADRASAAWRPGTRKMDLAVHLDQMALDRYWTGDYPPAETIARQVLELAEEVKSTEALLRGGAVLGVILIGMGRHEEALPVFDQAISRGRDLEMTPRWSARALNMSSVLYRDVYDLDEARRRNDEGAELGAAAGFFIAEVQAGIDHLFADLMEGEPGRAEGRWPGLWERAQSAKGWHQWLMAGRLLEAKAEIALAKGDFEAAAAGATEAIRDAQRYTRRKYETAARLVLGRALAGLGKPDRAVEELRAAVEGAERLSHPPTRWRAWWALGRSLEAAGAEDEAAAARARAAETIRTFATSLHAERAERLLGAEPIGEILKADGAA